jgi:S-layer homology domain
MSNLFKKVTSAVAGLAIVFSIVSPIAGVNAAYSSSLEAANKLASINVVKDNSANPADYRLGDTITRREVMKVAINLASCQSVALNTSYAGKFSDVPASDWAWKYAETAVDKGFVAANATFNPGRNVTKGEGLKMIMNVTKIDKASGGANFWADYVSAGVSAGIVDSFSDYDTIATRGWIFKVAANAIESGSCMPATDTGTGDLLDGLLDGIDTGTGTTSTGTTDTTPVTTNGGSVTVALSADTPTATTVPAAVKGLPVAAYDITAGAEDVTVTSLTVRRNGLSDKDTLTSIAAFTKDGRISKGKNDSLNNDTEAQLTLTNGLVIKAGETKSVWIVVDINGLTGLTHADAYDEFAINLVEITASAEVTTEGSLVANTMKVGAVEAATLVLGSNGTVSNPKLGEEGVEIFKFKAVGPSGSDIIIKSLTFKADGDADTDLANFKLYKGTTLVASTAATNGKYLTFNLGAGVTIGENKTEKFSVKADVIEGAADKISFYVDKTLDVSATDTKYGYGSNVDITGVDTVVTDLGQITINAGELTLVDVDATSDKVKENKDNIVLGKIKVTNVAGKDLELQQVGIKVDMTVGTSTTGTPLVAGTLANTFENFELYNEDTGASYELSQGTATNALGHDIAVFSDTDLGIAVAQGTTTFAIRVDTKNNINNFNTVKYNMTLATGKLSDHATTGAFYVVETNNDQPVTDLTPSALSWNVVNGTESSATVSLTPLADITKVRGSNDVVALQFDIKADDSSAIIVDEIKAYVQKDTGGTPGAAGNSQISAVALYKGSVSDANKLDQISGSSLA